VSSYQHHLTYNDYVLHQHENSQSEVNALATIPLFQGMIAMQVMIETFVGPFELTIEDMTKRKHSLLHHPWLLDKKYIFNECESVEKNYKKGGAKKKSNLGKNKANKKSERIQSHLE